MGKLKYDRDLLDFVEDKRPVIWPPCSQVLRIRAGAGLFVLRAVHAVLFI